MIQVARYLGVPPWELMEQPAVWTTWAATCAEAEALAQQAQERRGG